MGSEAKPGVPARIVFEAKRKVVVTIGCIWLVLGLIFLFLSLGAMVHGFQGPAAIPALFGIVGLVAALFGSLFVFGRRKVTIDSTAREVKSEFHWLGFRSQRIIPYAHFRGVCPGVAALPNLPPFYFVFLQGRTSLWLPGGSRHLKTVERSAQRLTTAMGKPFSSSPSAVGFGPIL